jgi:S-adenosylmethionine:tRNA ribosyltransferase-isomerase
MKLSDFDYHLPPELIATEPTEKRDQSRLLVLDRGLPLLTKERVGVRSFTIEHKHFFDLIDYLEPGDLLIANNSKVIPARLIGYKVADQSRPKWNNASGAKIEIFLSKRPLLNLPLNKGEEGGGVWECLVKGKVKPGAKVKLSDKLTATLLEPQENATWLVSFNLSGSDFFAELDQIGEVPLPPYIIKQRALSLNITDDKSEYQTVYADEAHKGSVAAPTAGLHFTPELIQKIKAKGVQVEYLTLHVGLGTFLPVKVENIEEHQIHSEWAEISQKTLKAIVETKQAGKRVIAVGTTSARTLEFFANVISNIQPARTTDIVQSGGFPMSNQCQNKNDKNDKVLDTRLPARQVRHLDLDIPNLADWVDIFIYPPYQFKIVDAMVTNFHLPKSTLLMLVSAMAGKKNIDQAYQEAIKEKYRFYSYGDAMLIK